MKYKTNLVVCFLRTSPSYSFLTVGLITSKNPPFCYHTSTCLYKSTALLLLFYFLSPTETLALLQHKEKDIPQK